MDRFNIEGDVVQIESLSEKDSLDESVVSSEEEIVTEYETLSDSDSDSENEDSNSSSSYDINKEVLKKEMKRRNTMLFKYGLTASRITGVMPPGSPANSA